MCRNQETRNETLLPPLLAIREFALGIQRFVRKERFAESTSGVQQAHSRMAGMGFVIPVLARLTLDHEHGPQTEWFDSGEKCVEVYSNHGVLHGPAREWFKNGQLRNQCQWVNGKLHGEMRHYDEHGTLLKVNQFDHGTLLSKRIPQLEPDETRGFTKQAFAVLQKEFNGRLEDHPPGSRADFIQAMKVCGAQIIDTSLSNGITKFSVSEIPYEENGEYFQPNTFRRTLQEWARVFGEFERLPSLPRC